MSMIKAVQAKGQFWAYHEPQPTKSLTGVLGLNVWVDRGGFQSHEWKRVERLEAVWDLAKLGLGSLDSTADSGLDEAVTVWEKTR